MFSTRGMHDSSCDFPTLSGQVNQYSSSTNYELCFNFGDIFYKVPGIVMHYLDDFKALGWSWLPPQEFIDRIMKGGSIKFTSNPLEDFGLNVERIGYLRPGEHKEEIVDTKGGDAFYKDAKPAQKGQAPKEFIARMKSLVDAAEKYAADSKANPSSNDFPAAENYENVVIPKAAARKLSYVNQFEKIKMLEEEKNKEPSDSKKYDLAQELQFFYIDKNVAVADAQSAYDAVYPFSDTCDELSNIPAIFAQLGIEFDSGVELPLLRLSGANLEKLKAMGAIIVENNPEPTFEEKIALATGFYPTKAVVGTRTVNNLTIDQRAIEFVQSLKEYTMFEDSELELMLNTHPETKNEFTDLCNKKIDKVFINSEGIFGEGKVSFIELAFPSHRALMYLMELLQDIGSGLCLQIESHKGLLQVQHNPCYTDKSKLLGDKFYRLMDKDYKKSVISKLRKKHAAHSLSSAANVADEKSFNTTSNNLSGHLQYSVFTQDTSNQNPSQSSAVTIAASQAASKASSTN